MTAALFAAARRLAIAGILGFLIALGLLFFMRSLIGGSQDNSQDNYFTRIFALDTVVLPRKHSRPSKPTAVLEQPDADELATGQSKAELADFLYSQELKQPDDIDAAIVLQPELTPPGMDAKH